jgi:predicted ester cyclase
MKSSLSSKIRAANSTLIGRRKLDAINRYFTRGYVCHLTDGEIRGHRAIRAFLVMLERGFPDIRVKVDVLLTGKDRISWQRTHRGTHKGDFMGFPATGRPIVWRDMIVTRFRGGLIAEEWAISDLAEQLLRARKRS